MNEFGYVTLDRLTLQRAEQAREADLASCVVRGAEVESAATRVRRTLSRRQVANEMHMRAEQQRQAGRVKARHQWIAAIGAAKVLPTRQVQR